jgi:CubicO group peptidase (beta-lactamase class C family)
VPLASKRFQDSGWASERLLSAYYGLGWFVYDYMGNPIVHHSGRLTGFNSLIAFSPEHQIGLVILANSDTLLPGALMAHFFDLLFDLTLTNWSKLLLTNETKVKAQNSAGNQSFDLTKN